MVDEAGLDGPQVTPDDAAHMAHAERRPGVAHVLDRGAVAVPLPGAGGENPLHGPDQPEGGVGRGPGFGHQVFEVEALDTGGGGDLGGRLGRNDRQFGLGLGQGGEDVEPALEPTLVGEDGAEFVRPPEMRIDR